MRFKRRSKMILKPGEKGNMSELSLGQRGIVIRMDSSNHEIKRRLLDMGITKGTVFEIRRISPLGDPVDIVLRGYELCIRKKEMESIQIEVIE